MLSSSIRFYVICSKETIKRYGISSSKKIYVFTLKYTSSDISVREYTSSDIYVGKSHRKNYNNETFLLKLSIEETDFSDKRFFKGADNSDFSGERIILPCFHWIILRVGVGVAPVSLSRSRLPDIVSFFSLVGWCVLLRSWVLSRSSTLEENLKNLSCTRYQVPFYLWEMKRALKLCKIPSNYAKNCR